MSRIQTNMGVYFDFHNPGLHEYKIEEIANSLSKICRFTGHVRQFYSVAEHSVYVSMLVPDELALAALLHDASEAYLGDVVSPLKALLPEYKAIERRVEMSIAAAFPQASGLWPLNPLIKEADLRMLWIEIADLLPMAGLQVPVRDKVVTDVQHPMNPAQARQLFLWRYQHLKDKHGL